MNDKHNNERLKNYNNKLLERLSIYLNNYSDCINKKMIDSLIKSCGFDERHAFMYLLADIMGLNITGGDRELFELYFDDMIKQQDTDKYINNPYYNDINIKNIQYNNIEYKHLAYKPYEGFVEDDFITLDNRIIPQIGFFNKRYRYPAILLDGREWMVITPNEINTMQQDIDDASGNVLTYGLGLGYYAYMVSLKDDVKSVTIVDNDDNIIYLFKRYILPKFKNKDKINIIKSDAFKYQKTREEHYDFVFTDIWHDVSDGLPLYKKMKKLERENEVYRYWIEKTIKCYMR